MFNTVYEQELVQYFPMTNLHCNVPCTPSASVCEPVNECGTEVPSKNGTNVGATEFVPCRRLKYQCSAILEETTSAVIDDDDEDDAVYPSLPAEFPSLPVDANSEINWSPHTPSSTHSSDWDVSLDDSVSNSSEALTITSGSTQTTQPKQEPTATDWLLLDAEDPEDEEEADENLVFEPKFPGNPAKGNFFISKEMIGRMITECNEPFITSTLLFADEKLAFDYFKQSVAMQIIDGQIEIHRTNKGKVIIIDIDLHFAANHQRMYLIAMLNDPAFQHKVKWQIVDFGTQQQIAREYGIYELPRSSRHNRKFQDLLSVVPYDVPMDVIYNTTFHKLPGKKSRRIGEKRDSVDMTEEDLKWWCAQSWNNGVLIPVVVIKGKRHWVEWKKLIQLPNGTDGSQQWVAISIRYYASNKNWQIECMDYDAGRIYYQHRLVGAYHPFSVAFRYLAPYVNTSLRILKPRY